MPFSKKVRVDLIFRSGRRCCVCAKFCGVNIEVDHIVQEADGGSNEPENGIPVCFDCHANIKHYNSKHPRGTKYTPVELQRHRERMFRWIEELGPVVFDLVSQQVISHPLTHENIQSTIDDIPKPTPVPLTDRAKAARYRRYCSAAWDSEQEGNFFEAARRYRTALELASSDSVNDYHKPRDALNISIITNKFWICCLEEWNKRPNNELARELFNMGINEGILEQKSYLNCRDYFYLLLQEKCFLFDESIRQHESLELRVGRFAELMELIEDRHCNDRVEELVFRAKELEGYLIGLMKTKENFF